MDIFVYADWIGLEGPAFMGTLSVSHTRGKEIFSFAYYKSWLEKMHNSTIDPDLQFVSGQQFLPQKKANFGIFMDSAPDRWGRTIMDRREAVQSRMEDRKAKKFFEEDYLLGVYDKHRMGALRFKTNHNGPFLHDQSGMAAPPFSSIRELEQASLKLERGILKDKEALKWLNLLLAPGASLGGARPKAGVVDAEGQLWIAKFPSASDMLDVGGWEKVANELGLMAGLNMAEGKAQKFNNKHHTFLTRRFDRINSGGRYHFGSAMTLLGKTDGDGAAGASYIDIRDFIVQFGSQPNEDLEELWKRIVFNIAIKNTDDHLRNHGFILTPAGWKLSPAYDVNPIYHGTGLTLNITETDNRLDLSLALSVAPLFRINNGKAEKIFKQVEKAISSWQKVASKYKIPRNEQDIMSHAFQS